MVDAFLFLFASFLCERQKNLKYLKLFDRTFLWLVALAFGFYQLKRVTLEISEKKILVFV